VNKIPLSACSIHQLRQLAQKRNLDGPQWSQHVRDFTKGNDDGPRAMDHARNILILLGITHARINEQNILEEVPPPPPVPRKTKLKPKLHLHQKKIVEQLRAQNAYVMVAPGAGKGITAIIQAQPPELKPDHQFSAEQKQMCFDQVKHPLYWRLPIDIIIDNPGPMNLMCLHQAIEDIHNRVPKISTTADGLVRVESAGFCIDA